MIKTTIKSFAGNEFKTPKDVYIWIGFMHGDKETVNVSMTFHESGAMAKENQMKKTDKALALMSMINPELTIKISALEKFTDFESLKNSIQKKIIELIGEVPHIVKVEII